MYYSCILLWPMGIKDWIQNKMKDSLDWIHDYNSEHGSFNQKQIQAVPKILLPLVHDIISTNGNGLRNWNRIYNNTNMCSLKMSGERTLKVLMNRSYGQIKFGNQNLKNTKVWKLRADWKVHNQGWTLQICNYQG